MVAAESAACLRIGCGLRSMAMKCFVALLGVDDDAHMLWHPCSAAVSK